MELKKIIIHRIEKKQGTNAKLTKAVKELTVTKVHSDFMEDVKTVYYKKSNPIYGIFDVQKDSFPFQKFLEDYLANKISFLSFTEKAIVHFEKVINEEYNATGGYVLFSHFTSTEEFVATILLNDKNAYIVDDNLNLKSNMNLDIEKLDVANFTNCSKWSDGEDVYLSFTRGKKDVSNYFKKFIGCTDYTSAKEASENLRKALNDYFIHANVDRKKTDEIKESVFAYCEKRMKTKDDISLDQVSSLVDHDEPLRFKEFASTEEYQVSPAFKGHKILKSLKYYASRSKELTIVFDSKLLGDRIVFNESKNSLLIKQIPETLRLQLSKQNPTEEENG